MFGLLILLQCFSQQTPLDRANPFFNQFVGLRFVGLRFGVTQRRYCVSHRYLLPSIGVGHVICVVFHVLYFPEMPEPDSLFLPDY